MVPSGWAYRFAVSADCPDGHDILFTLLTSDSEREIWESRFTIEVHAPEVAFEALEVDDSAGNGNGRLDPGETANLIVTLVNGGSEDATDATGTLRTADPHITILAETSSFGMVPGPGTADNEAAPFVVRADDAAPAAHMADFTIDFSSNGGLYATSTDFPAMIGHTEFLILDLDENHFSGPVMKSLLEGMGRKVDYITDFSVSLEGYSTIFVLLGIYTSRSEEGDKLSGTGRHHVLDESEALHLVDFLEQGGNLYMEGGETWYYDLKTSLHPMFHIQGLSDGGDDTEIILGVDDTLTEGMVFTYSGHNEYMDRLQAEDGAWPIFNNEDPHYANGIAYDSGTYRTIGTSFEFGGLDDGAPPSTKGELMSAMIGFFSNPHPCDLDGDGYEALSCGGDDCDDADPQVHPYYPENPQAGSCADGKDNDCDGLFDSADPDCTPPCAVHPALAANGPIGLSLIPALVLIWLVCFRSIPFPRRKRYLLDI